MASGLVVLRSHTTLFLHISGKCMISRTFRRVSRFTATGRDVKHGLHVNPLFGMFVSAIWGIIEEKSLLRETEVGQSYTVKKMTKHYVQFLHGALEVEGKEMK